MDKTKKKRSGQKTNRVSIAAKIEITPEAHARLRKLALDMGLSLIEMIERILEGDGTVARKIYPTLDRDYSEYGLRDHQDTGHL